MGSCKKPKVRKIWGIKKKVRKCKNSFKVLIQKSISLLSKVYLKGNMRNLHAFGHPSRMSQWKTNQQHCFPSLRAENMVYHSACGIPLRFPHGSCSSRSTRAVRLVLAPPDPRAYPKRHRYPKIRFYTAGTGIPLCAAFAWPWYKHRENTSS